MLSIGILLALFCAFATNVGFLLKHRGACAAPDVSLKHPVASAVGLFRSKWFAIGMLVALGAWVFHVAALAMAPLSVVQAVIAGGLVFLTVLAERCFGCSVGTRQWAGVGLTALGLVLLAVTLPTHGGGASYSLAAMIAFESGASGRRHLPGAVQEARQPRAPRRDARHRGRNPVRGLRRGDQGAHDRRRHRRARWACCSRPWLLTCIAASVIAFYASARGLQKGEAVPVITLTSAAANVTAISGGILVFGDPMPNYTLGIVIQSFAFVLVIVAAALTPAPLRATRATA